MTMSPSPLTQMLKTTRNWWFCTAKQFHHLTRTNLCEVERLLPMGRLRTHFQVCCRFHCKNHVHMCCMKPRRSRSFTCGLQTSMYLCRRDKTVAPFPSTVNFNLHKLPRGISEDSNYRNSISKTDTDRDDGQVINLNEDEYLGHVPVMVNEVLDLLHPQSGQIIVDMTFGGGGHAREILGRAPDICYIACDRDPIAHRAACQMADERRDQRIIPVWACFSEVPAFLDQHHIAGGSVDAFLFDLGASSMQFDTPERGFSLSRNGPLDMRMDGSRSSTSPTAADVVNKLDVRDLTNILKKYGEENKAQEIAHAIVEARYAFGNFSRTKQLADIVQSVFSSYAFRHDKMHRQAHVATKTFQALRIFVNNELNEIHNGLTVAHHYLKPNGRCVVVSFHSLEDRIVKRHFHGIDMDTASNLTIHDHYRNSEIAFDLEAIKKEYMQKEWNPMSRKVLLPSEHECYKNPRARSAKLRAAFKVDDSC